MTPAQQIRAAGEAIGAVVARFDSWGRARYCQNPDCGRPLIRSPNSGRPRKSCSAECARWIVVLQHRAARKGAQ